jgi:FkbM family methyltransferase
LADAVKRQKLPPFAKFAPLPETIKILDIGANTIDGLCPYAPLRKLGIGRVTGFEPNPVALEKLNAAKGPDDQFLPYVIGDGKKHTLHVCKTPGMTSLLKPHAENLSLFFRFAEWGEVIHTQSLQTFRLDDIAGLTPIDLFKIDIQGGELMVFKNATKCLSTTLMIQTEVYFLEHYVGQPLFSDIDLFLRSQGFRLYRLDPIYSRGFAPTVEPGSKPRKFHAQFFPHQSDEFVGFSQFVWADALYMKDITKLERYTTDELMRLAVILHECYAAYDVVLRLLVAYDGRMATTYAKSYAGMLVVP